MRFTDKQLNDYVTSNLALPGDERDEYREQVNRLLTKLENVIAADGSYRIKKFRRAGSLQKGTSNRPRAGKPVDADVGVYFEVDDVDDFDIGDLQRLIKKLLMTAYPQKSEEDFEEGSRTFGIVFKGSGLEIDLVPIVSLDDEANYGYQYSTTGDCVKTSVKVHVDHYREHAKKDPFLAPSVRMAKRWRHWQELDGIQSFHLELALSYLINRSGPAINLEESMRCLFLSIMRDLDKGLGFNGANLSRFSDAVVIVDPANDENNVASRVTSGERDALMKRARTAYETISWAQGLPGKGETVSAWKELLGDSFSIE